MRAINIVVTPAPSFVVYLIHCVNNNEDEFIYLVL